VFARDYPHLVAGLVICGTGGQFPPDDLGDWPQQLRAARKSGDREAWETALEAMFCGAGFRQRAPESFRFIADACWPPAVARGRWDSRVTPSDSYWGSAKCPSLLIYGGQDKNGTPKNARDLQSRLDGELHMFDDAGHFVVREREAEVAGLITRFARIHTQGLD
jgi:pimeloyl-ACP methyl ester carboxylesterase